MFLLLLFFAYLFLICRGNPSVVVTLRADRAAGFALDSRSETVQREQTGLQPCCKTKANKMHRCIDDK